uniref:Uncharacterized protein n=1 Tax=Arundo donax TaxID=35708 RepID=A0A0A9EK16_ARUDO
MYSKYQLLLTVFWKISIAQLHK